MIRKIFFIGVLMVLLCVPVAFSVGNDSFSVGFTLESVPSPPPPPGGGGGGGPTLPSLEVMPEALNYTIRPGECEKLTLIVTLANKDNATLNYTFGPTISSIFHEPEINIIEEGDTIIEVYACPAATIMPGITYSDFLTITSDLPSTHYVLVNIVITAALPEVTAPTGMEILGITPEKREEIVEAISSIGPFTVLIITALGIIGLLAYAYYKGFTLSSLFIKKLGV